MSNNNARWDNTQAVTHRQTHTDTHHYHNLPATQYKKTDERK